MDVWTDLGAYLKAVSGLGRGGGAAAEVGRQNHAKTRTGHLGGRATDGKEGEFSTDALVAGGSQEPGWGQAC